jgi:tetratricopeptide (TPR) repeat protein
MKKLIFILLMVPGLALAQKPVKPNVNKALNSWKAGKLDEAKEMIDLCTTAEKLMLDGKTWYYRALIYASIDTTSNETYKALSDQAFEVSMESFKKADELAKGNSEYFVQDANGFPITRPQQVATLSNHYLNRGAAAYQEDDFAGALRSFEKSQQLSPGDTTGYFYAGLVANQAENWDKAVDNMNNYYEKGGKTVDGYYVMINVYNTAKEDKNKALEIVRTARTKFPNNPELPKYEIQILIELDKVDEAKTGLEKALEKEANNKVLHYFLGYTNYKLEKYADAKTNFENALKIDSQYFDAQLMLAKLYYIEADKVKKEMSSLGISEADKKKKFDLDKIYMEKLKAALPVWEKAEKLNPSDTEVLDALYIMYTDLDNQPQMKRIEKRYKELGLDN